MTAGFPMSLWCVEWESAVSAALRMRSLELRHTQMRDQIGETIMNIGFEKLAALFHDELHRTFSVKFQWYTCSDLFQQAWEHRR